MDPAERVSQEARRIELEQTQELIREGVYQRLITTYRRGSFLQCIYDPIHCHYLLTLHYTREGKKFAVSIILNEEDFLRQSTDLPTWKTTLKGLATTLGAKLRSEMRAAGLRVTESGEPAVEPGKEYEARGRRGGFLTQEIRRMYEAGISHPTTVRSELAWADEIDEWDQCTCGGRSFGHLRSCPKYQAEQEQKEEAEAIESIKRTLAGQARSEEQ